LHWGNISPAFKAARRRRLRNTLDFGRTTTEEGCGDFAGLRVGYFLWWVISEEDVRCEGVKKREDDHERARNNEIQDIQYAALERGLEAQKRRVAEIGKIALSRIMQVWSSVHRHCRDVAEQDIRLSFDVSRLLMPVDHLVGCRLDVLMSKQLQDRLFSVQYADPNGLMEELRRLRERFDQISSAVADEPGLVLNLARSEEPEQSSVADFPVSAIVELQPA
jgi:hypothetical protein